MLEFIQYETKDVQTQVLADRIADELRAALAQKGRATLAVPGGSTPLPFLRALSEMELDWKNVSVTLTDERYVPETSDRSNTRMLRETLIANAAKDCQLFAFWREAETSEDLATAVGQDLKSLLPLDVCVVGMGADMHTASLFPGADRLDEGLNDPAGAVVLPMRAAGAPEPRLTITAPVLAAAQNLHLLIIGPEKKAALDQAQETSSSMDAPIKSLIKSNNTLYVHYTD